MPELPDIVVYLERLAALVQGQRLTTVRLGSPFLLRTVDPPLSEVNGRQLLSLSRLGKRLVFGLEGELYLVLHLMVAGRLHWAAGSTPRKLPGRRGLAAFDFSSGTVSLTEAGTKRRAALHLVRGEEALRRLDPGGIEVEQASAAEFEEALRRENQTLKRALTDPRLFSGIGGAYGDEILYRARLSPVKLSRALDEGEVARLRAASREVLAEWTARLRAEVGEGFPEHVTAFHPAMAVHGRFGQPCPACGSPVQRIVHVENETNYCARCQTGGRLLADRALSRLLRKDWPRTLEELEEGRAGRG